MGDLAHRRIRHQLTGHGDTIMVKRVASKGAGRLALLSQNLAYLPVEVSADEAEIIGRVVGKAGRL
ncbi:S24 family peptidase [Altererythrobacter sp.]|uniref:S24 family peptidase n=1 Tax=Altererythrobacter sp. TaxID=1872480 RepID=UPI00257C4C14|nr:S24 family peptidase [Altererythrobacter sp.]